MRSQLFLLVTDERRPQLDLRFLAALDEIHHSVVLWIAGGASWQRQLTHGGLFTVTD